MTTTSELRRATARLLVLAALAVGLLLPATAAQAAATSFQCRMPTSSSRPCQVAVRKSADFPDVRIRLTNNPVPTNVRLRNCDSGTVYRQLQVPGHDHNLRQLHPNLPPGTRLCLDLWTPAGYASAPVHYSTAYLYY